MFNIKAHINIVTKMYIKNILRINLNILFYKTPQEKGGARKKNTRLGHNPSECKKTIPKYTKISTYHNL